VTANHNRKPSQHASSRWTRTALARHCVGLRRHFRDNDFGALGCARILMASAQFLNPFLYLCSVADFIGHRCGQIFVDVFVCLKLAFPVFLLACSTPATPFLRGVSIYVIADTLLYVWAIVLSSGRSYTPASHQRSLLLIVVGFLAVNCSFAWLYFQGGEVAGLQTAVDAVYFSLVTATTVGFGDMYPASEHAKILAIFQVFSSLSYLTVIFSRFVSRLHDDRTKNQSGD
jgi:hypothetical protein